MLDLDAYFRRIDYTGITDPTIEILRGIHVAHRCAVPFENLDIHMGVPISLDIDHLAEKIVTNGRGGYCFEQNTLMLHVLREIGFDVTPREARVGSTDDPSRTRSHMTLEVRTSDGAYNVDAGFGTSGHVEPLPLDGSVHAEGGRQFRVVEQADVTVVQSPAAEGWADLYAIESGEPTPVDFDVASWYTSTHPKSSFRKMPVAQIQTLDERFDLRRRTYVHERGGVELERELSDEEIPALLIEAFGIDLGPGASRINFAGQAPSD